MFVVKASVAHVAARKIQFRGGENGTGGIKQLGTDYTEDPDFHVDGNHNGIFLLTADKMLLEKGRRQTVTLTTWVRPLDRLLAIKVNPKLYSVADISAPTWIDPADSGEIVLSITPREDVDLGEYDHIVKLLIESFS